MDINRCKTCIHFDDVREDCTLFVRLDYVVDKDYFEVRRIPIEEILNQDCHYAERIEDDGPDMF